MWAFNGQNRAGLFHKTMLRQEAMFVRLRWNLGRPNLLTPIKWLHIGDRMSWAGNWSAMAPVKCWAAVTHKYCAWAGLADCYRVLHIYANDGQINKKRSFNLWFQDSDNHWFRFENYQFAQSKRLPRRVTVKGHDLVSLESHMWERKTSHQLWKKFQKEYQELWD